MAGQNFAQKANVDPGQAAFGDNGRLPTSQAINRLQMCDSSKEEGLRFTAEKPGGGRGEGEQQKTCPLERERRQCLFENENEKKSNRRNRD